jgi:polynucleotide 5'-hydroxyl-kinase GRC3/NOL9
MAPPFCPPSLYPPPSPQATHCFGLGLIRSIDVINRKFLILTPLPFDTLKEVSGVVKGDLELPIWAMLDNRSGAGGGIAGVPWRKVPYVSFDANEGIGNSALRIRRNVMRKAQGSK